ncbi:ABC transporter ATP-binding protein [Candidatus Woesearchaeota archaeon CG11_big_fil_rev_8_21_14_0_20_43_8]|nr:MAG: ABC transporter ATP-binding protein [Candidatus Woesearchaeota archaeon CG11_big_fil_rev_8_21_14_0_20_43_8]
MSDALVVRNLRKEFGAVTAVNDISLDVKKGELFGLLGPNGSGKTTMIKLLTGQLGMTSGDAHVMGIDVQKDSIKVRELVGIIPEQETPPSFLTAEEYLEFVARIRKLDKIKERCDKWFKLLDFEDQKNALCKDLSRGTRQKLMFAQAFLHEPRFAFIDEPLINLDPIIQRKVKDFLKGYVKKGNTIFFSTHVLEIAEEICTNVAIIHNGKLLHSGPISSLKKKRQHLEEFFLRLVKDA